MKKTEIDYDNEEPIYCPVTKLLILDEGGPELSDACLFYYWSEPDFDFTCDNAALNSKYDEYLSILKTDSSPFSDWDKESMAMKLLLNELEKGNKNLELYSVLFMTSTATNEYAALNFCIDMNYKPTK